MHFQIPLTSRNHLILNLRQQQHIQLQEWCKPIPNFKPLTDLLPECLPRSSRHQNLKLQSQEGLPECQYKTSFSPKVFKKRQKSLTKHFEIVHFWKPLLALEFQNLMAGRTRQTVCLEGRQGILFLKTLFTQAKQGLKLVRRGLQYKWNSLMFSEVLVRELSK